MNDNQDALREFDLAILERQPARAEQALAHLKKHGASPSLLVREGQVRHLHGDARGALVCFNSALSLAPRLAVAYLAMGRLYADAGKPDQAMRAIRQSLDMDSTSPVAWYSAGILYVRQGDMNVATECFAKASALWPGCTIFVEALVHGLLLLGRYATAESLCESFEGDVTHKLHFHYADALYFQEKFRAAYDQYSLTVESPLGVKAVVRMCHCLVQLGALAEAVASIDRAIEQGSPEVAELMRLRASIYLFEGDSASAVTLLEKTIKRSPKHVYAWLTLFEIRPHMAEILGTDQLESLYAEPDENVRRAAAFALAIAAEERGDLAGQMRYLEEGNRLAARRFPYSVSAARRQFDEVTKAYSSGLAACHELAQQSFRPVFVLGLPRSGTTLVEQIVSAHSRVQATGESMALSEVFRCHTPKTIVTQRTPEIINEAREIYRAFQLVDDQVKTHYVDKNISLYKYVGLLKEMFPDAVFLALNRHPLDLMIGAWKRLFMSGNGFTYTVGSLAHEIRLYRDYIDYWSGVAGVDVMRVEYEELVSCPEIWIPALAEHCGLGWEEAMMSPASNSRAVLTASAAQVREGIHSNAVNRWRRYGNLLDPFVQALRHHGVSIPGYDA